MLLVGISALIDLLASDPNWAVRLAKRLETEAQEARGELRALVVTTAEWSGLFLPVDVQLPG